MSRGKAFKVSSRPPQLSVATTDRPTADPLKTLCWITAATLETYAAIGYITMADSVNPQEPLAAIETIATEVTATETPTVNESSNPETAHDAVPENGEVPAPVVSEEVKEEDNIASPPKPLPLKPLSPKHSALEGVPAAASEQTPTEQTPAGLVTEPEAAAEPLVVEVTAPAATESEVVKVNGDAGKQNGERVVASEKPQEKKEEDSIPPEGDSVVIPPHWHAKPCVHLTSIGGFVSEEELTPLFTEFGKILSIVFENERKDAAIIRYDTATAEGEQLVAKVKEKLHNAQLGDRSLLIEAFRSDSLLFIGNLTPDIDDALLRKMFEQHGTIERAFVLRNAAGRSKGYGFVEYSLKSQALNAKMAMGNINMDGRVLRVEWSDCRKIADMFSTVLFVDRIPKENPNVEASLRALFGQFGKVRDCHLAIGMNNQFRGFGFIDFYHSLCADMAHQALDGHELEGHSIRVSFANPSKSAQSYKLRFGSQAPSTTSGSMGGRGAYHGMTGNNHTRGHMPTPMLGQRFMGPGRSGMMGMGIGMQFGRGSHGGQPMLDQGHVGSGAGMLGSTAAPTGMMGRPPVVNTVPPRRGMAVGATLAPIPRLPGHSTINPATIAQVATAQAKAREAKSRAEEYYQHQPQQAADNMFRQGDSQYGYQQPYQQQTQQPYQQQSQQQQSTLQPQYQHSQQQAYGQYYAQPAQTYVQPQQQPQQGQYSQNTSYYQQQPIQQEQGIASQSYPYPQQYSQQYGQQYGAPVSQQYSQPYNQAASQSNVQQYQQQTAQPQVQSQYSQPAYTDHYAQPQQTQEKQLPMNAAAPSTNPAGYLTAQPQDATQQQAYAAYYQQQPQQNPTQAASVTAQTTAVVGTSQQSLEAQWAAYYASQAAYQQQAASYPQQQQQQVPTATATSYNEQPTTAPDVGQKRTAEQMEAGTQSQVAYNYPQQMTGNYPQQVATGAGAFQQNQAMPATAYQQNPAAPLSGYQLPSNAQPYQHQPAATGFQQPATVTVSSGYDKPVVPVADGYQQQAAGIAATFQPAAQGQAVAAPVYDYSKRPRF